MEKKLKAVGREILYGRNLCGGTIGRLGSLLPSPISDKERRKGWRSHLIHEDLGLALAGPTPSLMDDPVPDTEYSHPRGSTRGVEPTKAHVSANRILPRLARRLRELLCTELRRELCL